MSVEARILDSLRPIFPQLNDRVLSTCIRNVQETVGSDPATIIPGCIDMLLSGTFHEGNLPQVKSLAPAAPLRKDNPNSHAVKEDDDVVFVSTTHRAQTATRTATVIIDEPEIVAYNASSSTFSSAPTPSYNTSSTTSSASTPSFNTSSTSSTASTPSPPNAASKTRDPRRNLAFEGEIQAPLAPTSIISPGNRQDSDGQAQSVLVQPPSDPTEEAMKNLYTLFPDVRDDYLQSLLSKWSNIPPNEAINNACNELLENHDYPRKASTLTSPPVATQSPGNDQKEKDYLKDFSSFVSSKYYDQCLCLLQNEFRMIPLKYIRIALRKFRFHYAPSRKYLQEQLHISKVRSETATATVTSSSQATGTLPSTTAVTNSANDPGLSEQPPKIVLLKCGRSPVQLCCSSSQMDEELLREVEFVKKCDLSKTEERDRLFALTLNDQQYEEEGQKIECGCCYGDAAFEDMVQCLEGHLFCASCLMNYAKEAAFGQGKAALVCMSDGCDGTFPMSQLKKALPTNILEKYEDRVQEESLLLAQMDDFVRCPSCDFAAILPPEDKVFKCQNPSCAKETCRHCKEEWSEHFGLKCSEVEKSAQKDVRLSYEEKMTMAKIRKCPKCGCEFTKLDGCNKMTCRCGAKMCYVCRKPNIQYNHFCQHPKDPGKPCKKCTSCSLWSDPSEDDNRAVKELEKEALEAKRKFEAEQAESEDNPAKKAKTG